MARKVNNIFYSSSVWSLSTSACSSVILHCNVS